MARSRLVLLVLCAWLWAASADAASIAILEPAGSSPALSEASFRLRGELSALGIEVQLLGRPTPRDAAALDARAWLERTAAARGIDAILDIVGESTPSAVDLWIFERSPPRSQVARVVVEPGAPNPSETLAIRAIEVLRSYFLEIDLAARARRRPGAEPPPEDPAAGPPPRNGDTVQPPGDRSSARSSDAAGRVGVELGAGVLTSLDGVGPALLPLLRLDWAARSWLVVEATLSGLGTRPTLATSVGTVEVAQSYGLFGLCYCPLSGSGPKPFFGLSAGALRTALDGRADLPERGHIVEQWSFLLDAGLGARLRLPDRYYATLTAHAQLAAPRVAIHAVDAEVGSTGRPNVLVNLTVGALL